MFSQSLGRAARTTPPVASATAATASRQAPRFTHARRLSSNKAAPPPPGDGHRGSPAHTSTSDSSRAVEGERRPATRVNKKKAKDLTNPVATRQRNEAFANVPSVPSTSHLKEDDVKISSFFALHRPISVTMTYPPQSTSNKSFNALFDSPKPSTSRINDTIYTLNHAIANVEGAYRSQRSSVPQSQEEREARWELIQQQSGNGDGQVYHLDGPPPMSLDQMMKQFRPFNTPPAPIAFDPAFRKTDSEAMKKQAGVATVSKAKPDIRRKMYSTTLTIEETLKATGETTFTARCGPIRRIATRRRRGNSSIVLADGGHTVHTEGMAEPDSASQRREMLLISVRRQRKLKMKKHKYKKLMRKTRTLRRRQGRD